jgi:hypothetical protein
MAELFDLVVTAGTDGYLYMFTHQGGSPVSGGTTSAAKVNGMSEFLKGVYYRELREATLGTFNDSAVPTRLRSLRGFGRRLYREVIPSELRKAVAGMKKGDLLHVFADNCSIPWELVKNGEDDFWGQFFVISNSRWTGGSRVEPVTHTLHVKKILNVVGHGISTEAAEHARQLFQGHREEGADIQLIDGQDDPDATEQFYQELPNADLIHFTGHGKLDEAGVVYLQIVNEEQSSANFTVTSIESRLRPGCVVFANSCISQKTTTLISESLGFGPGFCESGASAFIGTLDLVPELEAVLFAEAFYNQLFSGLEVGIALRAAKQTPLKLGGTTSLAHLLYSLYGNPRERVGFGNTV